MRTFGLLIAGAVAALATPGFAQPYPDRPIKLIVPLVAGSPIVSVGRVVTTPLAARLGQQIVIDARPGGGTTIGLKAAASAPPDGYTLFMYGQNITYVHDLYPDLGVDPLKAFVPVANIMEFSHVLVIGSQVPAKSLKEFVAYAKANPGKLNFGAGLGTCRTSSVSISSRSPASTSPASPTVAVNRCGPTSWAAGFT